MFTFSAGSDNDLIEGTLEVLPDNALHHDHFFSKKRLWVAAIIFTAIIIFATFAVSRYRRNKSIRKTL